MWGGGGRQEMCWGEGGMGKAASFWDLRASTAITVVPSPGVYCVCVEEGRGVCGEGECLQVCGGRGGGGGRGGTRQPASGTSAPPLPSPSSPALLVCTVCV